MLNKVISSVILACSFAVMPLVGKHSDSLLFLFISPNKWVSTARLALALATFFISFKAFSRTFAHSPRLRKAMLVAGLSLIGFGLLSTLESSLGTFFYDYLKPLDLMIILEAGIICSSLALTTLPATQTVTQKTKAAPKLLHKTA